MNELNKLRGTFRSSLPTQRDGHPSDEVWQQLASGELRAVDKNAVLDHVLECPRCADIHQALLVLEDRAHAFDPGAPKPVRKPRRRWGFPVTRSWLFSGALATAAVIMVAVLLPVDWSGGGRIGEQRQVTRSATQVEGLRPIDPTGEVSSQPREFSWQAPETASVFVVDLLDGDGELLWTSDELERSTVGWPEAVEAADGRYYWRVRSFGMGFGAEQESELVAFDLSASSP